MNSYLNFYLVPKKREGQTEEPEPLHVSSYNKASEIYHRIVTTLDPVWVGNGDEPVYTELKAFDAHNLVNEAKDDLQKGKKRLNDYVEAHRSLAHLTPEQLDSYVNEHITMSGFIKELEEEILILGHIADVISDLEYSDFEKVLINID